MALLLRRTARASSPGLDLVAVHGPGAAPRFPHELDNPQTYFDSGVCAVVVETQPQSPPLRPRRCCTTRPGAASPRSAACSNLSSKMIWRRTAPALAADAVATP